MSGGKELEGDPSGTTTQLNGRGKDRKINRKKSQRRVVGGI